MEVCLNNITSLKIVADSIRQCWQSQETSDTKLDENNNSYWIDENDKKIMGCGPKDRALIYRIGNKFKHGSTLEHLVMNFTMSDISRALLQELARHRMASPSVKSTRYTLKELKLELPFKDDILNGNTSNFFKKNDLYSSEIGMRASKYLVYTYEVMVDIASIKALENLRILIVSGISNDKAKYCLPESYKTSCSWTINARSLQNFIHLRSSKSALWEIRDLAIQIFKTLPEEYKYLFIDSIEKEE